MVSNILLANHLIEELEFLAELHRICQQIATSKGNDLAWLQFATYENNGGYRFHDKSEAKWDTLEQIVELVSKSYPHMPTGKLVDILSHLVNTTINDAMHKSGKEVHKASLTHPSHGPSLYTTLIHFTNNPIYLPRHPWIIQTEHACVRPQLWQAHDFSQGQNVFVRKEEIIPHIHFYIVPINLT